MDLSTIVSRFVEGLRVVDSTTTTITRPRKKTEPPYHPGVPSMYEDAVAAEVSAWWKATYPSDFDPIEEFKLQVDYPTKPGATCDLVFSTDGVVASEPEWAIEIKRIQLVGNNGNNNDFGLAKMLSPYLKDRSLIHDLTRQREHAFARKHACIGYVFSYSFETVDVARRIHPHKSTELDNLEKVLRTNDREHGILRGEDLVTAANTIFREKGLVQRDVVVETFDDLWRHPCGGRGVVFGWEVK